MSDASSVTNVAPQSKGWGPIAGTLWALTGFIGPQLALVPLLPLIADLPLGSNAKTFTLYALVQLLTLGAIFAIIHGYGLKLRSIGLHRVRARHMLWALAGLPLYYIMSAIVVGIATQLLPKELVEQQQELGFTAGGPPLELTMIFIALVVVTPLVEEVIFRGFLLRGFSRFGPIIATLVVSLLFAVAHLQINVGLDVFILSLVLCYIRFKTDSLWPAVFLHALKNFIAFYLLFIIGIDV